MIQFIFYKMGIMHLLLREVLQKGKPNRRNKALQWERPLKQSSGFLTPPGLNHKLCRVSSLLTAAYRYNVEEPVMLMKDF